MSPSTDRATGVLERPTGVEDAELAALTALRDAALRLLALEADPQRPDAELAPARAAAAELYGRYVDRWGPLNRGVLHEGPVDPQTGEPTLTWRRPAGSVPTPTT